MRWVRQLHLYLGCFFAPLLVFYTATGWYQTLQIDRRKNPAEAETLASKLVAVHTDQIYPAAFANSWSPALFKVLVVVMSIGLLLSVLLGVYLAFRVVRQRVWVWLSLLLGVALPAIVLWIGAKR